MPYGRSVCTASLALGHGIRNAMAVLWLGAHLPSGVLGQLHERREVGVLLRKAEEVDADLEPNAHRATEKVAYGNVRRPWRNRRDRSGAQNSSPTASEARAQMGGWASHSPSVPTVEMLC